MGVYYAKYEGIILCGSGFKQISKNETPAYEVISELSFAALLLIIPVCNRYFRFLLIFPQQESFNKL